MLHCQKLVLQHLHVHALFANVRLEFLSFFVTQVRPLANNLAVLPLLTLLLQLFCEQRNFVCTALIKRTQLVIDDDVVHPVRIEQQTLKVFELLLQANRRAFFGGDLLFQSERFVTQACIFLFELRTTPIQLEQLLAVTRLVLGVSKPVKLYPLNITSPTS